MNLRHPAAQDLPQPQAADLPQPDDSRAESDPHSDEEDPNTNPARSDEPDTSLDERDPAAPEPLPFQRTRPPLAPGLYLVSTPIGNLEDISLRALRILGEADRIACEDTRQTQKLLNHFGLRTPTISYHQHNERERAAELLTALHAGARIAVVSDAGTPGLADPGAILARAAAEAGIPVIPIPGASALLAAITASGLDSDQIHFHGFLPAKSGERRSALEALRRTPELLAAAGLRPSATLEAFYEAPHRILDTLADLEVIFGPAQPVVLARELTKLHEEFLRGPVCVLRAALVARDSIRGEFVLLLPTIAAQDQPVPTQTVAQAIRALITAGATEKDALKQVARERSLGKSDVYREWQRHRRR